MAEKVKIDKDACIGCGACVSVAGESIVFDDDGKAECVKEVENADEVVANCPVGAISK